MLNQTLWIAIPVHNRRDHTRRCLQSLQRSALTDFRVVICDDGSTDGTTAMLRAEFPAVTVLAGDGQLWWAGGTNRCVEHILEHCAPDDVVLTLNNDTIVTEQYLADLMETSKHNPDALIGSLIVGLGDPESIVTGETELDWKRGIKRYKTRLGERMPLAMTDLRPVPKLPGKGTLIPVRVFREVGLYDAKNFPQYAADDDLSLRAAAAGFRLLLSYKARLQNDVSTTGIGMQFQRPQLGPFLKSLFSIRSPNNLMVRTRFALKHCPRRYLLQFILLDNARIIGSFFRRLLAHSGSGN